MHHNGAECPRATNNSCQGRGRDMRERFAGLVVLLMVMLCGGDVASAAEGQAYSAAMNYATPAVTIGKGDTLRFTNLDTLAQHDLVGGRRQVRERRSSAPASAPVDGVEKLYPGAYPFHCTLHTWMRGAVNVAPVGTGGADDPRHRRRRGRGAGSAAPGPDRPRPAGRGRAARRGRVAAVRQGPRQHPQRRQRRPDAGAGRRPRPAWSYFSPRRRLHRHARRRRQHPRRGHEQGQGPRPRTRPPAS